MKSVIANEIKVSFKGYSILFSVLSHNARSQPASLSAWGLDRGAKGAENETPKASMGVGNKEEVSPSPSRLGGLGKLPQRGPGPGLGEKGFYCFLSVSERLSLQRLLKIDVVHSYRWLRKMGLLNE